MRILVLVMMASAAQNIRLLAADAVHPCPGLQTTPLSIHPSKRPASGESTHQACCRMFGLKHDQAHAHTALPAGLSSSNAGFSFTHASLWALGAHAAPFTNPMDSLADAQETEYRGYVAPAPVAEGAMELTDTVTIHTYQYGIGGFADVHLGYRGVPGDPVSTVHVSLQTGGKQDKNRF